MTVVHKFVGDVNDVVVVKGDGRKEVYFVELRAPNGGRGRPRRYVSHWGKKTYETSKFTNAYMIAYRLHNEINA